MPKYHDLTIVASSPSTKVWLGDDEGHFVQTAVGTLKTCLLPGAYVVEFGLGNPSYPLRLERASRYTQEDLEAGPSCPRPVPQIRPADAF